MELLKKGIAEFIGTAVLVFVACGVAVYTGCNGAEGVIATALAFGLTIVAMAYSIGNISGCHINPAVSLAMLITNKITLKEFGVYLLSQFLGGLCGAIILGGVLGRYDSLGANQVQQAIVNGYSSTSAQYAVAFIVEVILTFIFVITVLGVTSKTENNSVAGVVIGLALTLVHLIGIYLTGTSVNPARSFGPALLQAFAGNTEALKEIWIFILAPLAGGSLAAVTYTFLTTNKDKSEITK